MSNNNPNEFIRGGGGGGSISSNNSGDLMPNTATMGSSNPLGPSPIVSAGGAILKSNRGLPPPHVPMDITRLSHAELVGRVRKLEADLLKLASDHNHMIRDANHRVQVCIIIAKKLNMIVLSLILLALVNNKCGWDGNGCKLETESVV